MSLLKSKRVNSLYLILNQVIWNPEEIKSFLQRNPSTVNEVNRIHETPLFRVLQSDKCSLDFVKVLLDHGAEVNCRNLNGETPLMVALHQSRGDEIIMVLIENGADARVFNDITGTTTLCYALRYSASKVVIKLLLDAGCHPNGCRKHVSALHCASDVPKDVLGEGILELLANAGADFLRFGPNGQSPVCLALQANARAKDIKWLLRQGFLLDACTKHDSIWFCATNYLYGHSERFFKTGFGWSTMLRSDVIELLRNEGVGPVVDRSRTYSYSPLELALRYCKYETQAIKMLLDFPGMDNNVRSKVSGNLLHLAVRNCYCKASVIELLIERGTKVDGVNIHKQTPLHAALWSGLKFWKLAVQRNFIGILLRNNSPVNAKDWKGQTPLRDAVELESHSDIVQLLLSAGARIGVRNDGILLLRLALNQYLKQKCQLTLDRLKLLVKYYFLENPDFKIESLTERKTTEIFAAELKNLADECAVEVQIMKSANIDDHRTLLDLIRERSLSRTIAADKNPAMSSDSLNNILRRMADNSINYFFKDIAAVVGKSAMEIKLQELQVYSVKICPVSNRVVEKIILIFDCVWEITPFLTREDAMGLILAYYFPANQINRRNSVRSDIKRKFEEYENCDEC